MSDQSHKLTQKDKSLQTLKIKIQVSVTSSPVNRTVPKRNNVPTCIALWG